MKCDNCGCEVDKNQTICLRCGKLLNANLNEIEIPKQRFRYTKKLGIIILFIVIFISIIVFNQIKQITILNKITPIEEINVSPNSFNYVNELYKSDHRHYKYLLDDNQKEIYERLLNSIKNYEPSIIIEKDKIDSKYLNEYLIEIFDAVNMDHPELIQFSTISYYNTIKEFNTVNIVYCIPKEKLNNALSEFKNVINEVKINTKNLNDYEKVKYVYDYLSENNTYDTTNSNMNQSAYSAISSKYSPVCSGYAKASQILLQNIGIESIITIGTINSTAHAWNLVKLNGNYYYFDATISSNNDSNLKYSGFLNKSSKYSYIYKKMIPKIKNKY